MTLAEGLLNQEFVAVDCETPPATIATQCARVSQASQDLVSAVVGETFDVHSLQAEN
jgi:hypothetical protein